MIHRPELLDALERAPTGPLAITAWRHMFASRQPDQENTGGARWNPPGVAAIYLSRTRDGAIAEGDHAVAVQPLRPTAARVVYAVALTLDNVVDLTGPADLARTGLSDGDLRSGDHTACREVGGALNWLGRDGLLVASARSTAATLVVYPTHCRPDARFDFGAGEPI